MIAVLFAAAKSLVGLRLQHSVDVQIGVMVTCASAVIAVPVIWGCLSKRGYWTWMCVAAVVSGLLVAAELGMLPSSIDARVIIMLPPAQALHSVLVLSVVRLTGFRPQLR